MVEAINQTRPSPTNSINQTRSVRATCHLNFGQAVDFQYSYSHSTKNGTHSRYMSSSVIQKSKAPVITILHVSAVCGQCHAFSVKFIQRISSLSQNENQLISRLGSLCLSVFKERESRNLCSNARDRAEHLDQCGHNRQTCSVKEQEDLV